MPCPFCSVEPHKAVLENEMAIAFPDAYPIAEGHTLVVPLRHVGSVYELSAEEQAASWRLVAEVRRSLIARYGVECFNIGINDGIAAGQTVPHAHVHVIPRWAGDVPDPRGGVRWVIASKAAYWEH